MQPENHADPLQEAMHHGVQRAIEVGSVAATAAQVYSHIKNGRARAATERDERIRRALNAQIRAERDAARAGWAAAFDSRWLRKADLLQTATAWGAAMPYADRAAPWYEPAAAAAMRQCEQRLRELHPHAMARYDRLRSDGLAAAAAMRDAAPLFTRPPHVRDGYYTPRPALGAADDTDPSEVTSAPSVVPSPDPEAASAAQEQRAREILHRLQARARAHGRDPLGEAEQRIILETVTNLPPAVIDRVVSPGPEEHAAQASAAGLTGTERSRAAAAEGVRAAELDTATDLTATPATDERTENLTGARDASLVAAGATTRAARTARPWERDFPMPITDVMTATSAQPAVRPSAVRAPAHKPTPRVQP